MRVVFSLLVLSLYLPLAGFAQANRPIVAGMQSATDAAGRTYFFTPDDPLQTRIYFLENGLAVYLAQNQAEPNVQSITAVRAGSKQDPADHTGLAHYLEHMLFKGTDRFGTLNYEKEAPLLEEIYGLYDLYNSTTDEAARAVIYRQIDSVSQLAAQYAIPNEYDKLTGQLGCTGTNAFTSNEVTAYINQVPSTELERFIRLEAERFRRPVMRLFHTELETVYEEKNRGLDNHGRQVAETRNALLYPTHPYGQQTTIGTIEHLKNPSLREIEAYYKRHYVPGNMAVILAGDLDFDQTIAWVEQYMGSWAAKPVPKWSYRPESPIQAVKRQSVYGPEQDAVSISYRLPGSQHVDLDALTLIDMIMANGTAGLIDLNLNNAQRIQTGYSYLSDNNDYSVFTMIGVPKAEQSLEDVEALLLRELDRVKQGDFDESLMEAAINDMAISRIRSAEQNTGRAYTYLGSFIGFQSYMRFHQQLERLRNLTKADLVRVANTYFQANNYVVVYQRNGELEEKPGVTKPPITPLEINREVTSSFHTELFQTPARTLSPSFVAYNEALQRQALTPAVQLISYPNAENERFSLYYVFEVGQLADPKTAFAVQYLEYLGTPAMSSASFKQRLFELGCSFNVSAGQDRVYVQISGLQRTFDDGVALVESLLTNPQADEEALQQLVIRSLKAREDAKLSKRTILFSALSNYAQYEGNNPFLTRLSEAELRSLTGEELIAAVKNLMAAPHRVLYYGPEDIDRVAQALREAHNMPEAATVQLPARPAYTYRSAEEPQVFFVHYDMVQTEILWLMPGEPFSQDRVPPARVFNEYFDGSMGSLVFQEIREAQGLAYSTYAAYETPGRQDEHFRFRAYVGTQADKLPEAVAAMSQLIQEPPRAEDAFAASKQALKTQYEADRLTREGVLMSYLREEQLGYDRQRNAQIYEALPTLAYQDISDFHAQYIKGRNFHLLVIGDREQVDLEALSQYGTVQELSLEEIFGY